jgi:hypothetical protein
MRHIRELTVTVVFVSAVSATSCGFADKTDLDVATPKTTLRVGETAQLSVIQRLPGGSTRDLTSPTSGTSYFTTSESMLIPEADGKATCIGTNGRDQESAVIGVVNAEHHGHVRFQLLNSGPGPGLEVLADRAMFHEGEKVQLHVFKSLPGDGHQDLTSVSTGTRYLTFAGTAFSDSSVIRLSETGLASAASSIGRDNHRTVIVFVRNADAVGWIALKVVKR